MLVYNVNSTLFSSYQHVQSEMGETSSMPLKGSEEEFEHSEFPPLLMEEQEETELSHMGQQNGTETFSSSESMLKILQQVLCECNNLTGTGL